MTLDGPILASPAVRVRFALEPAYNALGSLAFMAVAEDYPGVDPWLVEAAAALPAARREAQRVVFTGLLGVIKTVHGAWDDFPALVDGLAAADPVRLRDRALSLVLPPDAEEAERMALLEDVEAYIAAASANTPARLAPAPSVHRTVHALLDEPARLQAYLVEHLRDMWEAVLRDEWARVRPRLETVAATFRARDWTGLGPYEAVRRVTGRQPADLFGLAAEDIHTVIFIPSAHVGPYLGGFYHDGLLRLTFGARTPAAPSEQQALGRAELLVRLNALADDTRLALLEHIAAAGELCAQELIARLELSQSSASRHLRQLTVAGLLEDERRDVGKCYRVRRDALDATLDALRARAVRPTDAATVRRPASPD